MFFKKIKGLFRKKVKELENVSVDPVSVKEDDMTTLNKRVENVLRAMRDLEELIFCSKCDELFECRHKACPKCGESNQKYKLFNDEDQARAQEKFVAVIREFNELHEKS